MSKLNQMRCDRCHQEGADSVTQEGARAFHWHKECLSQGVTELHRAEEIALRYGFLPVPEKANLQGNPQFWPKNDEIFPA